MYNDEILNNDIERKKIVNNIGLKTLIANVLLSLLKIVVGFIAKSNAMVADGFHTVSDAISTIAVMIGFKFSSKEADESHPYGHERIESIVTVFLSMLLLFTGFKILFSGIKTIADNNFYTPKFIAVIVSIVSIIVKEIMYKYTLNAAIKINSTSLKADAWHHRSDALSSVGTLIGISGAMLGFKILDPIASVIVSLLVIKVAFEIFIQGFNQLIDKSADNDTIVFIKKNINSVEGVINIDDIKTRLHGSKFYVDVEIAVSSEISVNSGHIIAENVHNKIENVLPNVKHCMVHVNPYVDINLKSEL